MMQGGGKIGSESQKSEITEKPKTAGFFSKWRKFQQTEPKSHRILENFD